MDYLKEAVIAHWGDRCDTFEPECHCCKAWAEYDDIVELDREFYELAARYDVLAERVLQMAERMIGGRNHEQD